MEKKKVIVRTNDGVFLNSKAFFVEYMDIIKSPYFLLEFGLSETDTVKEPFDLSVLKGRTSDQLVEWYYNRNYQNIFLSLIPEEKLGTVNIEDIDKFADEQIKKNPSCVKSSTGLNMVEVIEKLMDADNLLVPDVYIWYPYDNDVIREDIEETFRNEHIKFIHGNLKNCIDKMPNDSTYAFSDAGNVHVLEELKRIDLSSILFPLDFRYNYVDDDFVINIEEFMKEHLCKINLFSATIEK